MIQWRSVQFSYSVVSDSVTPWIAARQASLPITNSWSSPKLMSIESVMPSSHLILCRPLLLLPPIPSSIRVFSNETILHMRWPKYWSFSFSISPCKEHPGLIDLLQNGLVGSPCSPRDSRLWLISNVWHRQGSWEYRSAMSPTQRASLMFGQWKWCLSPRLGIMEAWGRDGVVPHNSTFARNSFTPDYLLWAWSPILMTEGSPPPQSLDPGSCCFINCTLHPTPCKWRTRKDGRGRLPQISRWQV